MNLIQIGSGAGDQDPRADYRDGFTEFVKRQNKKRIKNLVLVEANPVNYKKLKKCWRNYKRSKIFITGIVSDIFKKKKIKFYYTEKDAPYYQTFSNDIEHVKKHYRKERTFKSKKINVKKISNFLNSNCNFTPIDYLSLDVEGMEYDILVNINYEKYNIKNISFEHIHLSKFQKINLFKKLHNSGYYLKGYGFDHRNFDLLFTKGDITLNRYLTKLIPYISNKHVKYILNLF